MEHEDTLIHSYMKHEEHCITTWIEFIFNSIQFKYIELKYSWNPQFNLVPLWFSCEQILNESNV